MKIIVIAIFLALSGCATNELKPLGSKFDPSSLEKEGVAIFSAGLNTDKVYFGMFPPDLLMNIVSTQNRNFRRQVEVWPSLLSNSNDINDDGKLNVYAVSLPAGNYRVINMLMLQKSSWGLGSQAVNVDFSLEAGEIVYIGSYRADVTAGALMDSRAESNLVVTDKSGRDLPILSKKMPAIDVTKIRIIELNANTEKSCC